MLGSHRVTILISNYCTSPPCLTSCTGPPSGSRQFTRIVLAIQVLSAGTTLPCKYITRRGVYRSLGVLLGPVMLGAVLITGLFVKA